MDDDLVERLRALTAVDGCQASREAADRIEALTAEVQRLTYDGIHTCHADCPRLPCTLRREIEALTAELAYHGVYPK